jgi:hypothetical protein
MDPVVVVQPVVNAPPAAAPTPAAQPLSISTDITGVTAPIAAGTQDQPTVNPDGTTPPPEAIPYQRFQEVVTAKNEQAERIRNLEAQVQVMERFAQAGNPPAAQPQEPVQPPSIIESALAEMGDDPYLNKDQVKTILMRMEQGISAKIAEMQAMASMPDYNQVVSNDPNSPLVQALNANPALVRIIRSSQNPRIAAYEIGKAFAARGPVATPIPTVPPPPPIVPAPSVPTIGALGGRGAIGGKPNYGTMTDAEFAEYQRRNAAGRIDI